MIDLVTNDKINACMAQAEFFDTRFNQRRAYEWKIALGFWAAVLAAIGYIKIPEPPVWVGVIAVVLYAFFWLKPVWVANRNDKNAAWHFRTHAEGLLIDAGLQVTACPPKLTGCKKRFGFLGDWAVRFQIIVTGLLMSLFYVVPRPE